MISQAYKEEFLICALRAVKAEFSEQSLRAQGDSFDTAELYFEAAKSGAGPKQCKDLFIRARQFYSTPNVKEALRLRIAKIDQTLQAQWPAEWNLPTRLHELAFPKIVHLLLILSYQAELCEGQVELVLQIQSLLSVLRKVNAVEEGSYWFINNFLIWIRLRNAMWEKVTRLTKQPDGSFFMWPTSEGFFRIVRGQPAGSPAIQVTICNRLSQLIAILQPVLRTLQEQQSPQLNEILQAHPTSPLNWTEKDAKIEAALLQVVMPRLAIHEILPNIQARMQAEFFYGDYECCSMMNKESLTYEDYRKLRKAFEKLEINVGTLVAAFRKYFQARIKYLEALEDESQSENLRRTFHDLHQLGTRG